MNRPIKTLVASCQDTLAKYLDALSDVGCVPYSLLKPSLMHATPQQLLRIEKANPDIAKESDELWLKHCLLINDIRQEYNKGMHRDPKTWRQIYLNREQENERKRQLIREKVKSQYHKIMDEKQKKSIKVLHNVVPTKRTYEAARQSTMTKRFKKTKDDTKKVLQIFNRPHNTAINPTLERMTSASPLSRAYDSYRPRYPPQPSPPRQHSPPLIAPPSRLPPPLKNPRSEKNEKERKPTAVVNFNIFNEVTTIQIPHTVV